ncbi:hypothetical protein NPIL_514031 [Nephila pilipes]|uniref:Uncharacterized protein n=1 Tax=Nephila pilipes TaxID=299642 RepID=A0A8X6TN62_NEPPI|nr:hypothetical protein NPIL_514031 [Nephila pilipes]
MSTSGFHQFEGFGVNCLIFIISPANTHCLHTLTQGIRQVLLPESRRSRIKENESDIDMPVPIQSEPMFCPHNRIPMNQTKETETQRDSLEMRSGRAESRKD